MPFTGLQPYWAILCVSILTGVAMLFIFKATSDQGGIKRAKNLVKGHFLAIRLYKDDLGLMFETMKNIIVSNLLYMSKSLRPMLFLTIPMGIILVQLGTRYEYRPLHVGETTVISMRIEDPAVRLDEVEIELPDGLLLDMPPLRIESLRELNWRIRAEKAGSFELGFKRGEATVHKQLLVQEALTPVAAEIARSNIGVKLMNPSEASIPQAAFASVIGIDYPKRDLEVFGISMHWLVAFFVISLVAAFSLKGIVGVEV